MIKVFATNIPVTEHERRLNERQFANNSLLKEGSNEFSPDAIKKWCESVRTTEDQTAKADSGKRKVSLVLDALLGTFLGVLCLFLKWRNIK